MQAPYVLTVDKAPERTCAALRHDATQHSSRAARRVFTRPRWKQVKNSEPCRGTKFLPLPASRVLHRDRRGGVVSEVCGFQSAAVVP